nr:hypothetical protein [uncultured Cohaesibacter sp.]
MQTSLAKTTEQAVDLPNLPQGVAVLDPIHPEDEGRIIETVQHAIRVVTKETRALKEGQKADLRSFSDEKSRVLLALSRLTAGRNIESFSSAATSELLVLRKLLAENHSVLKRHLDAVREITELLSKAMLEAESDGTYAAGIVEK